VTPGSLLDDDSAAQGSDIVTPKKRRRVVEADFCRREYMMSPRDRTVEVAEFLIPPGGYTRDQLAAHSGRDYGIVTSGKLVVELGSESFELGPGDYIAFDGGTPHRVCNPGRTPARAYWFVTHTDR
jgi:mannose-6-phosphate isomerase-like protein (cupin superfamily)